MEEKNEHGIVHEIDYQYDKEGMRSVLDNFSKQCEDAWKLGKGIDVMEEVDKIVVCGMGGSALPGDILKSYLDIKLPVFVVRDYNLPQFVTKKSLVFVISYSGNTEEIVSAYRQARRRECQIVIITSGGKLAELAQVDNTELITVPEGIQPRTAIGYQFFPMLRILQDSNVIPLVEGEVKETVKALKKDMYRKMAEELSEKLVGKIPIVYSSAKIGIVAMKWKIDFNENAKIHAFYNVFPEFNHNEINGYINKTGNFHAIMISDAEDTSRMTKRFKVVKELIKNKGVNVTEIAVTGRSLLTKIFSSIHMGDWTSYYLALRLKTDPTPVKIIEELKDKIKEARF